MTSQLLRMKSPFIDLKKRAAQRDLKADDTKTACRSAWRVGIKTPLDLLKIAVRGSLCFALSLMANVFAQDICTLSGSGDPCTLSPPFISGESNNDKSAGSCKKFVNITYQGRCIDGKLDGVVLLRRPPDKNVGGGVNWYLVHARSGWVEHPMVQFNSNGFHMYWAYDHPGCALWHSDLKARLSTEGLDCQVTREAWGDEVFSRDTWKTVVAGRFKIDNISWSEPKTSLKVNRPAPWEATEHRQSVDRNPDDPKTVGRGMRGG